MYTSVNPGSGVNGVYIIRTSYHDEIIETHSLREEKLSKLSKMQCSKSSSLLIDAAQKLQVLVRWRTLTSTIDFWRNPC